MNKRVIRVGSRESQLAMWQTHYVVGMLRAKCPEYQFEIIPIKTKGDKILDVALAKIGDKGLFTKELEIAMLEGNIEFAVHSMKDLPTVIHPSLIIGAMTRRHDPRDVLISQGGLKFTELPFGAKIGTSSLRRKAQILAVRPDLILEDIRGNINTRLDKLSSQGLDGIILAAAGVERLGMGDRISDRLDTSICLPAVGQGSIGIELKKDNEEVLNIVRMVNDTATEFCILAERALLRALEGGCQIPIGAHARVEDQQLHMEGVVGNIDGTIIIRDTISGKIEDAQDLGRQLAQQLADKGAKEILDNIRREIDL
ncbi:MAG: hydroxymethylbilane synthase [Bacillota bacterium]